jgi:hypothetical protein
MKKKPKKLTGRNYKSWKGTYECPYCHDARMGLRARYCSACGKLLPPPLSEQRLRISAPPPEQQPSIYELASLAVDVLRAKKYYEKALEEWEAKAMTSDERATYNEVLCWWTEWWETGRTERTDYNQWREDWGKGLMKSLEQRTSYDRVRDAYVPTVQGGRIESNRRKH